MICCKHVHILKKITNNNIKALVWKQFSAKNTYRNWIIVYNNHIGHTVAQQLGVNC